MEGFGEKENRDLLQLPIKGIEEGNIEVLNAKLVSDYSRKMVNSEGSNQEIEINHEQPSVSHEFDLVNKASNNQYLLNSSLSHKSQGYEIGEQCSQVRISDSKISNINHDITTQVNEPNAHETFNSQVAYLSRENLKTHEALLCNSKLEDDRPVYNNSSRSTYQSVSNEILLANTVNASHKKRHLSNKDNNQIHDTYRQEICGTRDQVISACSESGDLNKSETTNRTTFKNSCLTESPNLKEHNCHNQAMHEHGNLAKNLGLNIASNSNAFQSPLNETTPGEIPYSGGSKEFLRSIDDNIAVPGPSGIHRNQKASNSSGEKSQSIVSVERRLIGVEKKMLICKFCKNEIAEHRVAYEGKTLYKCCLCSFESEEKDFQIHLLVYTLDHFYCNVCKEVCTGLDWHYGVQRCNTCEEKFSCKGLLEQHSVDHEDYYKLHCRVCRSEITNHLSDDEQFYQCCCCPYKFKVRSYLLNHLYLHPDLRLFKCNMCCVRFTLYNVLQNHLRTVHDVKEDIVLT